MYMYTCSLIFICYISYRQATSWKNQELRVRTTGIERSARYYCQYNLVHLYVLASERFSLQKTRAFIYQRRDAKDRTH
jgi:hypothetical protein